MVYPLVGSVKPTILQRFLGFVIYHNHVGAFLLRFFMSIRERFRNSKEASWTADLAVDSHSGS